MSASGVGFRSERGPVLIALMLATALVAIDSTIIATAVPSIVGAIGGFAEFPWLFSIYLLAQAVTVPVYGKLADLFGRKPVMLWGIGGFLVGSVLCGVAWSMPTLIVFRALQGIGAGAVQPMSMTIVADLYSLEERAKVQGYIASVWGISAVVGPTLGGLFSEYLSWRWIFFVNIPVCVLAAGMLQRRFGEHLVRRKPPVDYVGASLLTAGCTLLILGALEGGQVWAWLSVTSAVVLGCGALLVGCFVLVERRAAEPVLPLWVFSRRLLLTTSLVAAGVGATVLGLTSYIPTFVQDVLGTGPLVAGFAEAALTLGWPIAASQAGRVYLRIGFRSCALIGTVLVLVGAGLLLALSATSPVIQVAATCFVIGLGMGWVVAPTLIAAQSSVGWSERGVITGTNMFCRSLGSALGVAAFGAIANAALRTSTGSMASAADSPAALATAAHRVFIAVFVVVIALTVAVYAMPRHRSVASAGDEPGREPAGLGTNPSVAADPAPR